MPPPVARIDVVQDTYHGTTIDDPYRWLEDWKGEEAQAWVAAQGAYARSYLEALPERGALLERITTLSQGESDVFAFQCAGGRFFSLRRAPTDRVSKLVVRDGLEGPERVLFNPNTIGGDVHTTLDWYVPSPSGALVAYGISQGGSEESVLHVLDVENGTSLDVAISRVRFGMISWVDNHSFIYNRLRELPSNAPPSERYMETRAYHHTLGGDPEGDPQVFGPGFNLTAPVAREDAPWVVLPRTSDWAIGLAVHFVLNELTIYAVPRAALLADPASCAWRKVCDVEDGVAGFAVRGDTMYLRTHRDAPRYKVVATSLAAPDLAAANVLVPQGAAVIEDIKIAGAHLLIKELDAGIGGLRRVPLAGGAAAPIPLPLEGTISELISDDVGPTALATMASWTVSPRVYALDADAEPGHVAVRDTGWREPSSANFTEIEAHEVQAPSADGTLTPLSIVHRKGLRHDGNNPTLLTGYGSYGFPLPPYFKAAMLAWLERGGVWAIGHIRGGGEHGQEWHEAGRKLNKGATIADFIACAEYLIREGYTSPERLAGEGTSAGGIPSGGAVVRRPDLWAAMVMRVAVTNMLRFETTENGPPNVPEFGSIATEDGFRGLRIMDSYSKVQDGVAYPAVLLTTGLNDPRVVVWMASKMAARLQAATSSGKPVLLRVEEQAGHGMGSTRQQEDEELADQFAFLLRQFGLTTAEGQTAQGKGS